MNNLINENKKIMIEPIFNVINIYGPFFEINKNL